MRRWRMGSLTLGFLLVALGCSFIISKLGIIDSIVHVLSWWPLAIILLGIEVLLGGFLFIDERCKLKFDGFSILAIFLILVICAGSFFASVLPIGNFNLNFPHSNIFYKDSSTFQKTLTVNPSDKNGFVVNNNLGNIQLQRSSSSSIEIEASIKIAYNDYDYAKSVPETLIKVSEGNVISLTSDRGQFQNDKVNIQTIDYVIKVPQKLNVEVVNKFGKVEVDSVGGNLKIDNANGSINVKTVNGSLTIDNKFGEVTASQVGGPAKISNTNGRITASDFNSDLAIECKFGDINVKNILGSSDIKNENGAIYFSSDKVIQNDVKLEGKFGGITLNLNSAQEGRFNLYTRHGTIKTSLPVSVNKDNTSESADASIGTVKNQFNIKNENGNISINKN